MVPLPAALRGRPLRAPPRPLRLPRRRLRRPQQPRRREGRQLHREDGPRRRGDYRRRRRHRTRRLVYNVNVTIFQLFYFHCVITLILTEPLLLSVRVHQEAALGQRLPAPEDGREPGGREPQLPGPHVPPHRRPGQFGVKFVVWVKWIFC